MGFKQLLDKVKQAELALEEKERQVVADWRHLKGAWREAWTPGRIVIAGLASGFLVGRAQPFRAAARSGQIMQLVTMLSGLFAGGTAKVAADEAEKAAHTTQSVADAVGAPVPGEVPPVAARDAAARSVDSPTVEP